MFAAFAVDLWLEKEIGVFVECRDAARWQRVNAFEFAGSVLLAVGNEERRHSGGPIVVSYFKIDLNRRFYIK
ncbi:hypothetical protein D3C86_2037710 [compost metagenome]